MCACVRAYHLLSLPFLSLIAHGPLHAAQARRDNTLTLAAAFQLLARLDRLVPLRAKQTLHPVAALVRHLPPRCIWRPIVCLRDGAGVGPIPLHDNCGARLASPVAFAGSSVHPAPAHTIRLRYLLR